MHFLGIGTATPPRRYTQRECWEAFQAQESFQRLPPRARAILKKVLNGTNGIETRHLAAEPLAEAFVLTPDALQARFLRSAPAIAAAAAAAALREAGLGPRDLDAAVVSTCTGYLCPGLTSYLSERLGLRDDALLLDLVGQGCGAAVPNLRTAEALLAGGRAGRVLSVCVEVSSAAFYLDDDPGVLVSACLFGDGAAAAVLGREPAPGRRAVRWRAASTVLSPADRDLLKFEQRGGMLRNILAHSVPAVAGRQAGAVFREVLARTGTRREEIAGWVLHAGGRDVLAALRAELALTEEETRWSAEVLREYGNLSSPFVLFVLDRALRGNAPGGLWWLASFGAGFASHGALLEVE